MSAFPIEQIQSVYLLIGSITAHWSYVEMGIDQMITAVYGRLNGQSIQHKRPGPFKDRIQFLRKAATLPALVKYKADLLQFATAAANIANERNTAIHSAIMSVTPENAVVLEMWKLRHGVSELKRTEMTLEHFAATHHKVLALAERSARIASAVIQQAASTPKRGGANKGP